MISVLISKVATLFLIMMIGVVLIKTKILKQEALSGLTSITLYVVIPCVVLRAFDTELTETMRNGIIFAFCTAISIHLFFFAMIPLMRKFLHFNQLEILSSIYPNSANLSIPLISAVLGWDYVIYTSGYIMVQQFFTWTHCRMMMQGKFVWDWKKLFLNINIIATIVGFVFLITHFHLPKIALDAIYSIADMVGPMSMLICGILLTSTNLSTCSAHPNWWITVLLRLVIFPLILVFVFKYSGIADLVTGGKDILLVTLFSVVTPPATVLTLMAQAYHQDAVYANFLNVISTLFFLFTMPLVLMLYLH